MLADPKFTPVTFAVVVGTVAPAGMATLDVTVTLLVSLLTSVTVTPPGGAGEDKVTLMGADWPGVTVTFFCKETTPRLATRRVAVPLA
jgi:hypothetical protein